MPKIGCGLDGLKWEDVKASVQDIFKDTDVEICVSMFDPINNRNKF